jgi:hypothetical protein
VGDGYETHAAILTAGGQTQSGGDVGFPQARIADEQHRLGLRQVVTLRQFQHLLPVELGQQGEVEIGQFLEQREVGVLDAALAAIAKAPVHLLLNQGGQIGFVGPAFPPWPPAPACGSVAGAPPVAVAVVVPPGGAWWGCSCACPFTSAVRNWS